MQDLLQRSPAVLLSALLVLGATGKAAILTGFVDIKPPKRDVCRVRTLEVYTQNVSGVWQMAQKESVRVLLAKP